MYTLKPFCAFLWALFLFSSSVSAADLDLSGVDDDAEATRKINVWLNDIGYTAKVSTSGDKLFLDEGDKYALLPLVTESGIDRIVIYKVFKGKPSNVNSEALHAIVRQINADFNVCTAFIDKGGALQLRFSIIFEDKLSPRLFRNTIQHVKAGSTAIIKEYREKFRPYFD
jgi:hypothetical protein